MANLAFLPEKITPCRYFCRISSHKVGPLFGLFRDTLMQEPSSNSGFNLRLIGSCARQAGNDPLVEKPAKTIKAKTTTIAVREFLRDIHTPLSTFLELKAESLTAANDSQRKRCDMWREETISRNVKDLPSMRNPLGKASAAQSLDGIAV